jgi:hypothetical protein
MVLMEVTEPRGRPDVMKETLDWLDHLGPVQTK